MANPNSACFLLYVALFYNVVFISKCGRISEASYRFLQIILDNHRPDGFWLYHGAIIRGEQRTEVSSDPEDYLVDDIIIWDPLQIYPNLPLRCPSCVECGSADQKLKETRWKDGKTKCDEPRHLYGLTKSAILVSRVYACTRRHQIIAHDPGILKQLHCVIPPFLLFYKTGVTRELHNFIITHAHAGLTMSEIQALWLQTMYDDYASRKELYTAAISDGQKPFPEFQQSFVWPGEKLIAACITYSYFKKEDLYSKRMCQMTTEEWLSCNLVSANIGFWFKNKWVKLYDTLFIVLNEEGVVLSWKLCKGTKFSSIEHVLTSLRERLERQGKKPKLFFVDNCCSWQIKLSEVFPDILTKMNLFHAIQRVVKKFPRKKGCSEKVQLLRRKMIQSFKMIFRDPNDKEEERTMATPSSETILENIDFFLHQWSKMEVDSVQLLPTSAIKEIDRLKVHATKGCLSDIPPSEGTNRNEVLCKTLKKSLRKPRIGLEIAVAFLGYFFYKWNEKKISKIKNKRRHISHINPVEVYNDEVTECKENFGGSLTATQSFEPAAFEISGNFSDTIDVIDSVNVLLEDHFSDESDSDTSSLSEEQSDVESSDENPSNYLDSAGICHIIEQASKCCSLSKHIEKLKSDCSLSNSYNLVNVKNILYLLTSKEHETLSKDQHNIDSFLQLNNMERVPVPGDGNCFFVSLATTIRHRLNAGLLNDQAKTHLLNLGVIKSGDVDIKEMASALRKVVVDEWLSNPLDYKPFLLSNQDYEEEVNLFLQDGHFASELGNSMPLAATNALQIPIVIFTDMAHFPALPISPRDRVLSDDPIYLAYDMSCAGHYDAIKQGPPEYQQELHSSETSLQTESKKHIICRCGQGAKRNTKDSVISCKEYKSRCKCYQSVKGCSSSCYCLNCENPHGKRVPSDKASNARCTSRKRRWHDISTERPGGKVYAEANAGGMSTAHWTLFEELVLMELILFLLSIEKLEIVALYNEYNHLVNTLRPTNTHSLGLKTEKQVAKKLSLLLKSQKVFKKLMTEQVQ